MENQFVREYQGQLWIEIMLVDGMNDSPQDIAAFKEFLGGIDYDQVYLNTPVRPPAEGFVHTSAPERIDAAAQELGGISIDRLTSGSFFSEVADPYEAMLSIARRRPMNQFEVESFLESRGIARRSGRPLWSGWDRTPVSRCCPTRESLPTA